MNEISKIINASIHTSWNTNQGVIIYLSRGYEGLWCNIWSKVCSICWRIWGSRGWLWLSKILSVLWNISISARDAFFSKAHLSIFANLAHFFLPSRYKSLFSHFIYVWPSFHWLLASSLSLSYFENEKVQSWYHNVGILLLIWEFLSKIPQVFGTYSFFWSLQTHDIVWCSCISCRLVWFAFHFLCTK